MKIVTILNNSALIAQSKEGKEFVLIGRGIGFNRKYGELVDDTKIERIFDGETKQTNNLLDILDYVPEEYFENVATIVRYANKKMGKELDKGIYITLTDHIHSAIERYNEKRKLNFPLLSEMKQLYPEEHQISEWIIEYLNATYDIELPEDEVGFIMVHIVAAVIQSDDLSLANKTTILVDIIVNIVKDSYGKKIDITSIHYSRFLTHLKFFAIRYFQKKQLKDNLQFEYQTDDNDLEFIKDIIEKITKALYLKYGQSLSEYEIKYLELHLLRLAKYN